MSKVFLEEVAVNTQSECDCAGWLQAVALLLLLTNSGQEFAGDSLLTPLWDWCWNIQNFKCNGDRQLHLECMTGSSQIDSHRVFKNSLVFNHIDPSYLYYKTWF